MSIFISDLGLLRTTLEHCVWTKQRILQSPALSSYYWVEILVYVCKWYFVEVRETTKPNMSL